MGGMSEFLGMGGYAAFVWPAYLFAAAVLVGLMAASLRQLRAARESLSALEGPDGPRR